MRISIKKVCIRGEPRWKVDLKSFGSKRSRRFFRTKEEAKAEVANLKQQSRQCGDSWALLGGREKMEILAAVRLASEHGFKLREAVETCIQTVGQGRNTTSGEAFARFLAEKEKMRLSPRSIRALRSNVGRFVRGREDVPVSRIRREDVVEWLHRPEWGPRTYNSYLISLTTFFRWCVNADLIQKSPAATVPKIGKKQMPDLDEPPGVLNINQCRSLLRAALEIDPGLIPYIAVGIFAGLRPVKEAGRLTWNDVEGDKILVRAAHAKDGQRRYVDIHPTLKAWLELGGDLPVVNLRRRFERVRARAGLISLKKIDGKERLQIAWTGFDQDCLRHTFASHYLPLNGAEKTTAQMGHASYEMLFSHYRKLVPEEEAKAFWDGLTPASVVSKLFEVTAA